MTIIKLRTPWTLRPPHGNGLRWPGGGLRFLAQQFCITSMSTDACTALLRLLGVQDADGHGYRKAVQTGKTDAGDCRPARNACNCSYPGWRHCRAGCEPKPRKPDGRRTLARAYGGNVRSRFKAAGHGGSERIESKTSL